MFPSLPKIPIQELKADWLLENNVKLLIKREDLLHAEVSGNKWRKLELNYNYFEQNNYTEIVTFGGAFSNHIAATAALGKITGVKTIGVIRGEPVALNNSTLAKAIEDGMEIHFVSREAYKQKAVSAEVVHILKELEKPYVIPEGGANRLGLLGCAKITKGIKDVDVFAVAAGTGSTFGGMVAGASSKSWILGFPVLKGMHSMVRDIDGALFEAGITDEGNWSLNHDYHFGGYAKADQRLIDFINDFWITHRVKLDPIYTAKAMFGVVDLIKKGVLKNQTVMFIHTGGMQGVKGFERRYNVTLFEGAE